MANMRCNGGFDTCHSDGAGTGAPSVDINDAFINLPLTEFTGMPHAEVAIYRKRINRINRIFNIFVPTVSEYFLKG